MNVFETEADRYERWFENHPETYRSEVAAIQAALNDVSPNGRGLEIGTGTGRFSVPFGITEGVEPSAAMRRIAERRGLKVLDAKAEALPYGDYTFDFALIITTICFVDDPLKACRETYRVLKAGGRLVIGLVDVDSNLGQRYETRRNKSRFYHTARFFSVPEVVTIMDGAGFGNFSYHQTLFRSPETPDVEEPVKEGFGKGGFVVISGKKLPKAQT